MEAATRVTSRHAFSARLLEEMRENQEIYVVTSDARGSAALGDIERELPERFVELGIAEQNTVGVAAGLANCGKRVFVCGPSCFYAARSLEQIKNDVAYAKSDVKIIGVSGGVAYGALGSTHHSLHDLAVMRAIPGIGIFLPCDVAQTRAVTSFLAGIPGPSYLRVGRNAVPDVYEPGQPAFLFGKANMLQDGDACTIIAAGETVHHARAAARELSGRGIAIRVLDMPTIKPLDEEAILRAARETGAIVTLEEHSIYGGLGSAVAEVVVEAHPVPMKIIGFPDRFLPAGSQAELFEHFGLCGPLLVSTVESFLARIGHR